MSRQTAATAYSTAIVRSNPLHRCACTESLARTAIFSAGVAIRGSVCGGKVCAPPQAFVIPILELVPPEETIVWVLTRLYNPAELGAPH